MNRQVSRREHALRIDYLDGAKGVSCSRCLVFMVDGVRQTVFCDEAPPSNGWDDGRQVTDGRRR